ncbi:hypothetical protein BJ875DRAFT_512080 [Amylocarpus encephaloides]|uniref:Uncharacterized protein n=1 Tax=Amylocarpus encephaloides TaxID=45428 RepID=A0A9P7YHV5_9HELO|nr:hypothetical protein BJ875DRAFT_512080 [Amylocarpus encephaloides]
MREIGVPSLECLHSASLSVLETLGFCRLSPHQWCRPSSSEEKKPPNESHKRIPLSRSPRVSTRKDGNNSIKLPTDGQRTRRVVVGQLGPTPRGAQRVKVSPPFEPRTHRLAHCSAPSHSQHLLQGRRQGSRINLEAGRTGLDRSRHVRLQNQRSVTPYRACLCLPSGDPFSPAPTSGRRARRIKDMDVRSQEPGARSQDHTVRWYELPLSSRLRPVVKYASHMTPRPLNFRNFAGLKPQGLWGSSMPPRRLVEPVPAPSVCPSPAARVASLASLATYGGPMAEDRWPREGECPDPLDLPPWTHRLDHGAWQAELCLSPAAGWVAHLTMANPWLMDTA